MKRIYFDHAASTPMDPLVATEVNRALHGCFGNASSLHFEGVQAKEQVDSARQRMSALLRCHQEEIIFTSGGTESNNLALKGYALAHSGKGNHILVSAIEHDCILNTCRWLQRIGFRITAIPVNSDGLVDPEDVKNLIEPSTLLISVMHVNNETGAIQPIAKIGQIAHEHGIAFHTDACQSFGKLSIVPEIIQADMITINAHKIYGPKGVGALYVKKGTALEPLLHGGGQEFGIRSTTENLAGILGFIKAAELSYVRMEEDRAHALRLRERLITNLEAMFENVYFNGAVHSVPGIVNFSFRDQEGEGMRLLLSLDEMGISVSAGSACSANHSNASGSHVLSAMGLNPIEARGAVRVSFGRFNTTEEVDQLCQSLKSIKNQFHPSYNNVL